VDACGAFCGDEEEYSYCEGALGINVEGKGLPCNLLLYNPGATWMTGETLPDGGSRCRTATTAPRTRAPVAIASLNSLQPV